eukprot:3209718-Prymnesium_polylepis.1
MVRRAFSAGKAARGRWPMPMVAPGGGVGHAVPLARRGRYIVVCTQRRRRRRRRREESARMRSAGAVWGEN